MNHTNTFPGNGNNRRSATIDISEEEKPTDSTFYDPTNRVFAPARQIDQVKQKRRKRRLIGFCLVLALLAVSAIAAYRLLGVNRVKVRVQADARRETQNAKTKNDSNSSENSLSTEAVNLTRQALGSDSPAPTANSTASPTPALTQLNSATSTPLVLPSLSGTVNQPSSNDSGVTNTSIPSSRSATALEQSSSRSNAAADVAAQSRANPTQSIYVEDSTPKLATTLSANEPTQSSSRNQIKNPSKADVAPPAVLPPFGTMLPVRTQGVIFTLRNNSYARLELIRDMKGNGWSLAKGTVLIGRASGSEYDRAFINVIGYIDSRENKLIKMSGEVLGSDGGSGIQGKRVVVDSGGLKRALSKIASTGVQAAGMLASGFGGQRTVIVDGAGSRIFNPLTDEAGRLVGGANNDKRAFVKVEAGRSAYVMVADLPRDRPAIDAPGVDELTRGANSLSDRDLMELLLFGTREEISAAIPLMTHEQKNLALKTLATGNDKK